MSAQVWEGTARLEGERVIPEGAVLLVRPGTRVEIEPGARLLVEGRLEAEGADGAEVSFLPKGPWGGLVLQKNASARICGARLSGAQDEMIFCRGRSSLELLGTRLKGSGNGLRCEDEARAALEDCEILEARYVGVLAAGRSRVDVRGGTMSLNETAITLHEQARADVRGARLSVNELCGVNVMDQARLRASRCLLAGNHTAVSLSGRADGDLRDNAIRRNQVGVHARDRAALNVVGNDFTQNRQEIDLLGEARVAARLEEPA